MEKFEYKENDLLCGDSQCDLCVHFIQEKKICKLMGKIPAQIASDEITCEQFEYEE